MKINGTELVESSLAGHGIAGKMNSRLITSAVKEWELGRKDEEGWQLCWDGVYRKPSAIRALVVVR